MPECENLCTEQPLTGCPSASPVRTRRFMSQLHGPPWSGSSGRCPHLPSCCQNVSTGGSSSSCTAMDARLTASPGSRWCSEQLWCLCPRTTSVPPVPGRLPKAVPQLHMVSGELSGKGYNKWGGQGAGKGGWSHSPAPRTSERQGHSSEALAPAQTRVCTACGVARGPQASLVSQGQRSGGGHR